MARRRESVRQAARAAVAGTAGAAVATAKRGLVEAAAHEASQVVSLAWSTITSKEVSWWWKALIALIGPVLLVVGALLALLNVIDNEFERRASAGEPVWWWLRHLPTGFLAGTGLLIGGGILYGYFLAIVWLWGLVTGTGWSIALLVGLVGLAVYRHAHAQPIGWEMAGLLIGSFLAMIKFFGWGGLELIAVVAILATAALVAGVARYAYKTFRN